MTALYSSHALDIARRVERVVGDVVAPCAKDRRHDHRDGPTVASIAELEEKARAADVLKPHVLPGRGHLTRCETAPVLRSAFGKLLKHELRA